MTLGDRIAALRTARKLSQGELAEKLNVSRQSVSKWETGASTPELDKLILLCELFQISLDELVGRTENAAPPQPAPAPAQPQPRPVSTQRVVGFILLAIGLLCCVLALFAGSGLFVIGGYLLLCSVVCLWMKRYAGLAIGWFTLVQAILLTPYFTGVRMFAVFHPGYYSHGLGPNQIVSILMWVLLGFLAAGTLRAFRGGKKK